MNFKCPYCNKYKSNKEKVYSSWRSVSAHLKHCEKKTGEYCIHLKEGPVHYTELLKTAKADLSQKFGVVALIDMNKTFKRRGFYTKDIFASYTKEDCAQALLNFKEETGLEPTTKTYKKLNSSMPCMKTIFNVCGSWNEAMTAAGLQVNTSIFGAQTTGKDNYLYRSQAEAYFADMFLFNKYEYIIEPKYPEPYYKFYDWYVKELDLYIELDGGIRPNIVEEKKQINKLLSINCIFIPSNTIYSKSDLQDFISILDTKHTNKEV